MVWPGQVSCQVVAWLEKYLHLCHYSKSVKDTIPNTFFGIVIWNMCSKAEAWRMRYAPIWKPIADCFIVVLICYIKIVQVQVQPSTRAMQGTIPQIIYGSWIPGKMYLVPGTKVPDSRSYGRTYLYLYIGPYQYIVSRDMQVPGSPRYQSR